MILRSGYQQANFNLQCRDCGHVQSSDYESGCTDCGGPNLAVSRGRPRRKRTGHAVQTFDELARLEWDADEIEMYERSHLRVMTPAEVKERLLWERGE